MRRNQGQKGPGNVYFAAFGGKPLPQEEIDRREATTSRVQVDIDWRGEAAIAPLSIQPQHALILLAAFIELCAYLLDMYTRH